MNSQLSANEMQARFVEIGLPEALMVELQVTDYDLGWDAAARANRERFLEQGYILVVDRRGGVPISYLAAPNRNHTSVAEINDRISLVSSGRN